MSVASGPPVFSFTATSSVTAHSRTVGVLSQDMIVRLLEEKKEESSKTISRFRTFVKWLSVNAMETDMKEEVLKLLDFNHFTTKELASDVMTSGLYSKDRIIERMQELYDADALKVGKEIREDMKVVRDSVVCYNGLEMVE